MTKDQMEQIVQRQLDAYNRRDLINFCECYHSEVKVVNLISNQVICDGIERFKEIYKGLFESSPNLNAQIKSRLVLDSAIIDEEFVSGASKYPNGLHAVAIYGFRDGKIDHVWFPR